MPVTNGFPCQVEVNYETSDALCQATATHHFSITFLSEFGNLPDLKIEPTDLSGSVSIEMRQSSTLSCCNPSSFF